MPIARKDTENGTNSHGPQAVDQHAHTALTHKALLLIQRLGDLMANTVIPTINSCEGANSGLSGHQWAQQIKRTSDERTACGHVMWGSTS